MNDIDEVAVNALDDDEFERIVLANMSHPKRDPRVWAVLVSPGVVRRTQATLVAAVQRNAAALGSRPGSRATGSARCGAGGADRAWRRRASDFAQIVEAALVEVKAHRRVIEAAADRANARAAT